MRVCAIVCAAGSGSRFGGLKQLASLGGTPIVVHAVRALRDANVEAIVVAAPPAERGAIENALHGIADVTVVDGGRERSDSVFNALAVLPDSDIVLVHDGARPLPSVSLVSRVVEAAAESGAAIPIIAVRDTIKRAVAVTLPENGSLTLTGTVDRQGLWAAQTPQGFRAPLLRSGYAQWDAEGRPSVTDDAAIVERTGGSVVGVVGDSANIKVTTPEDLRMLEGLALARAPGVPRVGFGRDRHPLIDGRPLVLAGITLMRDRGPLGHSDGDVLCHAIADAMLGACAAGDLGQLFPDSDEANRGIDGLYVLHGALRRVQEKKLNVSSVDATIWIREPRMAPHIEGIRSAVAKALGVDMQRVSVKAKSGNGLDAIGEGLAVEGEAVVVLI